MNHDLRAWIDAPVQLLAAGRARHAPLMSRLAGVSAPTGITLELDAAAAAPLAADEPVIVLVYTGAEIAQFRSRVLRLVSPSQVELACPREMRFHRLRREARRPSCVPATVAVGGQQTAVTLIDVSDAGCHLTCPTPLGWQGTRVRLLLAAADHGDGGERRATDAIDGEIRWVSQIATDDVPHFACGIRFDAPGSHRAVLAASAA